MSSFEVPVWLQPEELSAHSRRAVDELLHEGDSENTLRSYRSALRYWAAWFLGRYGRKIELPVPAGAVLQFIVDHAQRSSTEGLVHELPPRLDADLVAAGFKARPGAMSLNWIVHRTAVLSKTHRLAKVLNPCEDPQVRQLLSRTRRAFAKRGELPKKKTPSRAIRCRPCWTAATTRCRAVATGPCCCLPGPAAGAAVPRSAGRTCAF
jgi:hypothetical protein